MRDIIFRGKRLDNGKWVEGFYFERKDTSGKIIEAVIIKDAYEQIMYGQRFIRSNMRSECFRIDPETVGQFAGLTDKNGKKIFEGDIIECWSEGVKAKGTVQQNRGGLWIIYPEWQKYIMWRLCPHEDGSTDVEIIGNIHDNQELMEDSNV